MYAIEIGFGKLNLSLGYKIEVALPPVPVPLDTNLSYIFLKNVKILLKINLMVLVY